jgi:hypothetical protein
MLLHYLVYENRFFKIKYIVISILATEEVENIPVFLYFQKLFKRSDFEQAAARPSNRFTHFIQGQKCFLWIGRCNFF